MNLNYDFNSDYKWASQSGEVDAIYMLSYEERKPIKIIKQDDLLSRKLKDGSRISKANKYINKELNLLCDTLVDGILNMNHTEWECWINLFKDYYSDSILSQDKAERYRITREKLLKNS
jgi:hypothetical protein